MKISKFHYYDYTGISGVDFSAILYKFVHTVNKYTLIIVTNDLVLELKLLPQALS